MKRLFPAASAALALTIGVCQAQTLDVNAATNKCIWQARNTDVKFDAYYDDATQKWHEFGTPRGIFYFRMCMTREGFSLGQDTRD